jgi:LEA14-like dessication related protein
MNTSFISKLSVFILVFSHLVGCAGLTERPDPPRISIAGLEVIEIGLFEQRYLLKLRLQNPNDFDIKISGMDYEVFVNDSPFAHGVSRNAVNLPSFGEDVFDVEVVSSLTSLFNQLRTLEQGQDRPLNYRITGGIKVNNWPRKIPFEFKGETTAFSGKNKEI